MEDSLLIKYFNGEATEQEKASILAWAEESEENSKYFAKLSDVWFVAQTVNKKQGNTKMESVRSMIKGQKRISLESSETFKWRILYFGAAAIIVLLLIINLFHTTGPAKSDVYDSVAELSQFSANVHTIYTPKGTKALVTLPDSSVVKLNSDTRITFPDKFTGSTREVLIDGEGFFDVTKDSLHPMIVSASKGYKIKVLGTKFNVCSYSDDEFSKTTLIDGAINILSGKKSGDIKEGELLAKLSVGQSYIEKDAPTCQVQKYKNVDDEIAWTEDKLIFNDTPMSDVIKRLERWHGMKFVVKNPAVLSVKMTAMYENESLVQILEVIKFSTGILYSISNNKVYLDIEK